MKLARIALPFVFAATTIYACGDSNSGFGTTGTSDDAGTAATKKDGSSSATDGATSDLDGSTATDAKKKDTGAADVAAGDASSSDAADADVADAADAGWPDCTSQPVGVPTKTIADVWTDNASTPTQVWISGAIVTAVSRGGCAASQACQIYVQSASTFGSLAAGAHHAIKLSVSSTVSDRFVGVAAGDVVDVLAWGWRYTGNGQNEILMQVNAGLPGCTKKTGTATPTPIAGVNLSDLTHAGYETYGPLLVKLTSVSGKAQASATETFGLYATGTDGGFPDAGNDILSLSPFFLPGATFTNPPIVPSVVNAFSSLTGVFGLFTPVADGGAPTYLEFYPRSSADIVK